MATYKHLKYDGKEILAGAAYRDSTGKNIANTYATNTSVDSKIQQATGELSPVATSGSYSDLDNKPKVNNVELSGDKTLSELGIATKTSELTNDANFVTKDADNLTNYTKSSDINSALAQKVDLEVAGTKGTAKIFNESDGGGAQFVGTGTYQGFVAYVGTHDSIGGEIGTQIYVDKPNGTESTIIDVTQNGAYYNKGTIQSGTVRDVEARELAVRGDIPTKLSDLTNDSDFVDKHVEDLTYYTKTTDLAAVATSGKYSDLSDKPTIPTKVSDLNNDSGFITNASLTPISTRIDNVEASVPTKTSQLTNDSGFVTDISGKVDKEISTALGQAQIFNEADGGGAHFIYTDSAESFIGVNNDGSGSDGMMAQIYADKYVSGSWSGSRINIYNDKIYYQSKAKTDASVAKNNEALEIATIGDLRLPADITTDITVGHLASGTTLTAGTSIFNILQQMLVGSTPTGDKIVYKGILNSEPTSVVGLTGEETEGSTLIASGYSLTGAPDGQYPVVAVTKALGVKLNTWVDNNAPGFALPFTTVETTTAYIYYINGPADPAGDGSTVTYTFTFVAS